MGYRRPVRGQYARQEILPRLPRALTGFPGGQAYWQAIDSSTALSEASSLERMPQMGCELASGCTGSGRRRSMLFLRMELTEL